MNVNTLITCFATSVAMSGIATGLSIVNGLFVLQSYVTRQSQDGLEEIEKYMNENDIHQHVKIISEFAQKSKEELCKLPDDYFYRDNLISIILSVQEAIIKVREDLTNIERRIAYNKGLWMLKKARAYKFITPMNQLKISYSVMVHRIDTYFKIYKQAETEYALKQYNKSQEFYKK
jgi:hypothetical protein